MANCGYHSARACGSALRAAYAAMLAATVARPIQSPADVPLEVYSYSGEAALPEQVASARSFLRHAGRPKKFTIVSDGTYSEKSQSLLRHIDPCVVISNASEWLPTDVHPQLRPYLTEHPTGKQLALIMSLPADGPALYVDSDVLFFSGARMLRSPLTSAGAPVDYLADCQLSADDRLFRNDSEKQQPVNTGVLLLRRKLDWSLSVERFLELQGAPTFFTNQTMTHLTMHANAAQALDPEKFVLQLDDQFVFREHYASGALVLRHYVNPVRHKFWTSLIRSRNDVR